jgi:peptidoglycan/xylan/chitin deacetylase (PgdA/CDA1 family)
MRMASEWALPLFISSQYRGGARRVAMDLAARAAWRMPGCFGFTRMLGPSYLLRCVVFHNISATESEFTRGMGVSITPSHFETVLKFIAKYYVPVRLQDVLDDRDGRSLPPRAVLVTFDDGYASAAESAATLCRKFGVPVVFFLNAAFVDNHRLAPDNLVCYIANTLGIGAINAAARSAEATVAPNLQSLTEVFTRFFPAISLTKRKHFLDALVRIGEISEARLAKAAGLYVTSEQVRSMASLNCEIGSHTYTHVRCRSLSPQTFGEEIDRNKVELESLSGTKVRSFSLPYGSSEDLTADLINHLQSSGHEAVFLSESVTNPRGADPRRIDRVSPRGAGEDVFFFEMEVLPRLRAIRNRLKLSNTNSGSVPGAAASA